ncbi:MAG: hypothetical protein KDJ45_15425, partial [Hyphomicrobiaceae bacterium]|nr:hypothetical protein [Hyphomicrobiaceae bacterium]
KVLLRGAPLLSHAMKLLRRGGLSPGDSGRTGLMVKTIPPSTLSGFTKLSKKNFIFDDHHDHGLV